MAWEEFKKYQVIMNKSLLSLQISFLLNEGTRTDDLNNPIQFQHSATLRLRLSIVGKRKLLYMGDEYNSVYIEILEVFQRNPKRGKISEG